MATEQGLSRLTLGEIGNRVSAITIDTAKGGAIKKEILQPSDSILTRARTARLKAAKELLPADSHVHVSEKISEVSIYYMESQFFEYMSSKDIYFCAF